MHENNFMYKCILLLTGTSKSSFPMAKACMYGVDLI